MKTYLKTSSICLLGIALITSAHTSHLHSENSGADDRVVLNRIPRDRSHFRDDVAPLINQIIARHGEQEWEIVVLTNEFHRHLGIYSILGAKMGLAARDHFHVGLDAMTILSHAGQRPPISCLNDGLQVSTGATLGHGTIRIADSNAPTPSAQFTHDEKTVTLTLKSVYWNQIKADIQQTIKTHGRNTPAYWDAVRQLGLKYWLQWSRHELFDIAE
ncbi:formylmethanofuran dehydrogenase subunit E family protein [Planctomycetota bacterium]